MSLASDGSSRLFDVAEGKTLTLKNIKLSGGADSDNAGGGAILNRGPLILIDCEITHCFTPGQGGAIHSLGDLTVIRSVISNNTATGSAGGIFHTGGNLIGNNQSVTAAFSPRSPNAGNDIVNVAAKISPLTGKSSPGNNGCNTEQTMLLLPGSPAIENAVVTAFSPSADMLGRMRGPTPSG